MGRHLEEKENEAIGLIEDVSGKYDDPVVACSWGKDSLTVLHLVNRIIDDFRVLWNNTQVHYPDVYRIKTELEDEWGLDIVEKKANKTFWEIVEEHGWPGIESSDRSDPANNACCYHVKKKPTKDAINEHGWDLYFDGLTAYESDRRFLNLQEYGKNHYHKSFDLQKVHPIAYWTVDDVWDYIEEYEIPYPDLYDKEVGEYTKRGYSEQRQGHRVDRAIRNGCWTCTLTLKKCPEKMEQLRKHYPKMWKFLMKDQGLSAKIAERKLGGQGDLFDGYVNEDIEHWLDKRPCFFDKL